MQGIRDIIFDLGGVIIELNYQKTQDAFTQLGVQNFEKHFNQFKSSQLFETYEMGQISTDEFLSQFSKVVPENVQTHQIIEAWNAMLGTYPLRNLQILQQLRNHYGLYLLSNNNALHLQGCNQILERERGLPSLNLFFDKSYYSHLVGKRKPNADIYLQVLEENGLDPKHTLFIDDTLPNIEAAQALGLQTIHLVKPQTLNDIFRNKAAETI
jgi:epoxide hydrolase-like predicted phosphatase